MVANARLINVSANFKVSTPILEALHKMNSFYNTGVQIIWNSTLHEKQLRFLILMFCLLNCHNTTNGKEARIQRRFMWKQMHMDNLVSGMATRAFAMKNALSDLVPTIHSVMPNKVLDYLPSETTRIKYIIRNPTTNQPMKIINIRPNKKIVKLITKPTVTSESKPVLLHKKIVPTYPNADQMKKMEMEQELLTEGRLSIQSGNDLFNHITDSEKYTPQPKQGMGEQYNSWLPVLDTSKISSLSSSKPNTKSLLHTSIMAEPLQSLEKQIPEKSIFSTNDKEHEEKHDSARLQNYFYNPIHINSYEVTENIAEESIDSPLIKDSQISLRIGTAPSRFDPRHTTNIDTNREENVGSTTVSLSTEEPPNYPTNFLRRFRERSKLTTVSPSITSTSLTLRTQQQKNTANLNGDWMPKTSNITNIMETHKFKTRIQGTHNKSEKWPLNVPGRFSIYENFADMKSPVVSSTTTAATSVAEIKKSDMLSTGRLKAQLSIPTKISKNAEIRELRVHNRGRIKFGDKIISE